MPDEWFEISFEVIGDEAAELEQRLAEQGALAVTLSAGNDQRVYDEPGEDTNLWSIARVTALFPQSADLAAVYAACAPYQASEHKHVAERPWHRLWMSRYKPIQFGDGLWLRPSWCAPVIGARCEVVLDPGMAFGTGTHPTTRLCLEWLCKCRLLSGASLIDYGCGSGILAIAGAKLGARQVCALDVDAQAREATNDNVQRNSASDVITVLTAEQRPKPADILIANILLRPLLQLCSAFAQLVRPGGAIAVSGLTLEQTDQCLAVYAQWFSMEPPVVADEWVLLHGVRKDLARR